MVDLARWLGECLDEDQREAEEALRRTTTTRRWIGGQWVEDTVQPPEWRRSVWVPARVLREINAKQRTLLRCQEALLVENLMLVHFAKQTLWDMARAYEHRPGYEEAIASLP